MKIVFALPPYRVSDSWGSSRKLNTGILPSMGVGYLAAMLVRNGHDVALVDAPALDLTPDETVERLLAEKPDLIGISCVTVRAKTGYALATLLKQHAPDIPIILGGPHATAFHRQVLEECPAVDYVIPGEAEFALADFVDALSAKRSTSDLPGLIYRAADGTIASNPPADEIRDLDTLPWPVRSIYPNEIYKPLPNQGRKSPSTIVLSSRGCPWARCAFCYQGGIYACRYRRRSPEDVVAEVTQLVREQGYREIMFWDENFAINEKWVAKFCDLLDTAGIRIPWTCEGYVKTMTEPMLRRMAASGCYNIFLGLETGNQELLDLVHKGTTLDDARRGVQMARRAGMEIRASFILGLPRETPEMARKTIEFACELNPEYVNFVPYHVWHGTPLEKLALEEGRNLGFGVNFLEPSYVPNTYESADQLREMLRFAYRRFYGRPRYMARLAMQAWRPSMFLRYCAGFRYWMGMMMQRRAPGAAGDD
jgi:radical SAM superfamily enzyme YgiQ (UPF0313 family)